MKLLLIFALCLGSCKKYGTGFDCQCTNQPDTHYNEQYETAKAFCEEDARELSAQHGKVINCKIR